jgi:hypothetical protein
MIDTSLFPYENHPYRLEYGEKKNVTICWFACDEHLQKHIIRYKLKVNEITVKYRDEKPIQSSQRDKKKLQQTTGKNSHRSAGSVSKRTTRMDTN